VTRHNMPEFERGDDGRPLVVDPNDPSQKIAYGRPSHYGSIIDDHGALDAWEKRCVAKGVALSDNLRSQAAELDVRKDAGTLDLIVEDAMAKAGARDGANAGTLRHTLTEALDWGEEVECTPEVRRDLDAYQRAMDAHGLTVVPGMIEVRAVCDELGVAGTFDRIYSMRGEGILDADLKCGQSSDFFGVTYAVQQAIYNHSQLYDTRTGARSPMPEGLRLDKALIIWLPAGQGRCEVIEVDTTEGWQLAQLCYEAYEARSRASTLFTKRPAPGFFTADPPKPNPIPAFTDPADPRRRQWVISRLAALTPDARESMAAHWPTGVPGLKAHDGHSDAELALIVAVLDRVEAQHTIPFGAPDPTLPAPPGKPAPAVSKPRPATIDEGPTMADTDVAVLRTHLEALPDDQRQTVIAWHHEAHQADRSFSLGVLPSARRFEILRACIWAVTCFSSEKATDLDELVRAALAGVTESDVPLQPGTIIGACFGALTIDEATRLVDVADRFAGGDVTPVIDGNGYVRLPMAA